MILTTHVARQLWIQLRLLPLLALPSIGALAAVVIQDEIGIQGARVVLAIGFAVSMIVSAALVGAAFTDEIRSGSVAWLAVRAVPRPAILAAWLVIPVVSVVMAFIVAGTLGGLGLPPLPDGSADPVAAAVAVLAAAAPALPLTAAALGIAVHAGPRATMVVVLVGGLAAVGLALVLGTQAIHPASGYWLVAGMAPAERPISVGLQSIGLSVALAAVIWFVVIAVFERRDL